MSFSRYALALSALLLTGRASAQVTPAPVPPPAPASASPAAAPVPSLPRPTGSGPGYGAGMKFSLSPDGSKYVRLITWHQVWTRYNDNNAGTLRAPSAPQKNQVDFGLRRSRLLLIAQLNPRFLILTHLGINNQDAVSGGAPGDAAAPGRKPQLFVHEAVGEYKVNNWLSIGGGLHYQNGLSRMTRASTLNFLALDAPMTNWATIDQIDQFGRWLGMYAKGRIKKFDYAVSVNDPFLTNATSTPDQLATGVANYNPRGTKHVYQGYFSYSFLESESNLLPYAVGSYLGTKRVFNIGAGFLNDAQGMYSRPEANPTTLPTNKFDIPTKTHDINLLAADVFYDTPLDTAAGTALTFYGVYYNYDFGPKYVRYVGALNPGYGATATRGNAVPVIGTGQAQYAQVGFLLPKRLLGKKARLQPYVGYMHAQWDGLTKTDGKKQDVHILDLGANLLLDGHNAKITLNYRPRPDFAAGTTKPVYRNEVTVQTMVFL